MRAVFVRAGAAVDVYRHGPVGKRLAVDHNRRTDARRLAVLFSYTANRRGGYRRDRGGMLWTVALELLSQRLKSRAASDAVDRE